MSTTTKRPVLTTAAGFVLWLVIVNPTPADGQSIHLHASDATVWTTDLVIKGHLEAAGQTGILYVDSLAAPFEAISDSFAVPIQLESGLHLVYACTEAGLGTVCSDTLNLTLGFTPAPEVFVWPTVIDRAVTLHARILENPGDSSISFRWRPDPDNPVPTTISNETDSVSTVSFGANLPNGEYYFDLEATDLDGRSGHARTFVTKTDSTVTPFDIWSDHAAWVDAAVIYEITPYNFVADGQLLDVRRRLSEFVELGVNTIWIQPIFETRYGGQGYDVTNYFKLRPDYGTEATLRNLVQVAHRLGLKVLLDFVPNHTSIHHPYARDAMKNGVRSHYFDFYQREFDTAPYSRHYNKRVDGNMTFVYYFWDDLVNINYNNPEVVRWMTEAGQYWIERFDIDGYRIDAVWGVNGRTPEAMQNWRFDLKRIKPEILLLGEDKATRPESFEKRFDVAYDWYPEESWVSHWTWQYDFSTTRNPTIFNISNERARSTLLRDALTNRNQGFHRDAKVLHFMENNDIFRFAATHPSVAASKTRMVATLLFALPGVPMIYNGQEIGFPTHPYSTHAVFDHLLPIARQDRLGIYPHYQHLISLRKQFRALTIGDFAEVPVQPSDVDDYVFAFKRSVDQEHVLTVINMGSREETALLELDIADLDLPDADRYFLTSIMTGDTLGWTAKDPSPISITMPALSTDVFVISDAIIDVVLPTPTEGDEYAPVSTRVVSYPNPFSEQTTLMFELARGAHVNLEVYDLLGRVVERLVNQTMTAGVHRVVLDGSRLADGHYLFRLVAGEATASGIMVKAE